MYEVRNINFLLCDLNTNYLQSQNTQQYHCVPNLFAKAHFLEVS